MFAKIGFCLATSLALESAAMACPQCRPLVQAGIYNPAFALNFGLLMLPLGLLIGLSLAVYRLK